MEMLRKFAIRMPQSLKRDIVEAAAKETIATGELVSASEWVREACEMRLEKDQ